MHLHLKTCKYKLKWHKISKDTAHRNHTYVHRQYKQGQNHLQLQPTDWFWVSFIILVMMFRSRSAADQLLPNHLLAAQIRPSIIVAPNNSPSNSWLYA